MEILYGCVGVAVIILALGAVSSIPSVLALIEKITLHDPSARRDPPNGPLGPPDSPWGRRNQG